MINTARENENVTNSRAVPPSIPPPPPYTTVLYKAAAEQEQQHQQQIQYETNPPPSYADIQNNSMTYINNYPDPPLTDGVVQFSSVDSTTNIIGITTSKKFRRFLLISGLLTLSFGFAEIGVQLAIILNRSVIHYYYGFWCGAVLLTIAVNTIIVSRNRQVIYSKLFHSSFWEVIVVSIMLIVGIIIVTTGRCDDDIPFTDSRPSRCQKSGVALDAFLIILVALPLIQSISNTVLFRILSQRNQSTT